MTLLPTRRHFLKGTGAALTVSAFGFPALALPARKARLGVALVGLGGYSTGRLAPGLQQTLHCELRGIVTGSPEKIPVWQERYGILDRNVYSYETLDTIADNDEIRRVLPEFGLLRKRLADASMFKVPANRPRAWRCYVGTLRRGSIDVPTLVLPHPDAFRCSTDARAAISAEVGAVMAALAKGTGLDG